MKFSDFVCFEATVPELRAGDRDGVIAELVSSLDEAGKLGKDKCQEITAEIIKREREKLRYRPLVRSTKRKLAKINRQIRNIHLSKTLTGQEKRNQIDNLIERKNRLTKIMYEKTKGVF